MGFKQTVVQPALHRRTGPDEPKAASRMTVGRVGHQWMDDVDDRDFRARQGADFVEGIA